MKAVDVHATLERDRIVRNRRAVILGIMVRYNTTKHRLERWPCHAFRASAAVL